MSSAWDAFAWIDDELAELDRLSLRRRPATRQGRQSATVALENRRVVNFGSNDYLGYAGDPRLAEAAARAAAEEGTGAGASPLVSGRGDEQARLEARLAEFEGTEAALVFASGFAANSATIAALAGREDAIFSDELNHASLIDGCRLSGAKIHVYPHADVDRLEAMLSAAAGVRRRLVVTDSLFSMDGDLAPLAELAASAERHRAMLLVDEAHATGVLGPTGRGGLEACGVDAPSIVRVGTLSKALGSLGGFVAGQQRLIDWLSNRARSYVFSTALAPACCAAARMALSLVDDEPRRRERLHDAGQHVRQALSQGWQVGSGTSPIIPLVVGNAERALALKRTLWQQDLFVPAIRPPTVPAGTSRLRISLSALHSDDDLDKLISALAAVVTRR